MSKDQSAIGLLERVRTSYVLANEELEGLRRYLQARGAICASSSGTEQPVGMGSTASWEGERWTSADGYSLFFGRARLDDGSPTQYGWRAAARSQCPEWTLAVVAERMAHFRRRVEDVVFCQAALLRACEPRGRTAEMIATGIHQAQRRLDTALRIAATIGGQKMPSDLDNPGVASVIHEARLEILATVASLS